MKLAHVFRTPAKTRWLALSIWLLIVLAPLVSGMHFFARAMRGDYPPQADSIGIPIFLHLLLFFPFELRSLRGLKSYQGGLFLFSFSRRRPWSALASTVGTIYPIGMWCLAMIVDGVQSGFYGTALFFILRAYAFLLLRAGLMRSYDMPFPISSRPFGIALGSNLGDREANLRRGVALLVERVHPTAIIAGGCYETAPVDCEPGTQAFLNSVIEIQAACTPAELHTHLQAVEQTMGRPVVREKNSPRSLDLDLLYAGDFVSDDPVLTLPHPRLHLRRFVLQPLADIRSELILPGHQRTIAEHLGALTDDPDEVRLVQKVWMKTV